MSVAALVLLGDLALRPVPAAGFAHQGSRIRFQEHSPAVFDQARREGKPIFLLFSAAWCYWCKTFEQDALRADEVTAHLNRHWLSVFVDHDLRPDLVSRYVRGLPMVVLFGPDGRVRQSFAGALRKEDFLSVLQRIEGEVRVAQVAPEPGPRPERPVVVPQPVSVTPSGYRSLLAGVARYVDEQADSVHGGFGVGTKAPNGRLLVFLLEQEGLLRGRTRRAAIERTLDAIIRSLHDPVAGGFFHYATGRDWSDPRYEKLLHVNASLIEAFDRAHRLTRVDRYRQVASMTAAYMLGAFYDRERGGFFNSQVADPAYYRLGREARRAAAAPPVLRGKITAANAEAVLAFLAVGEGRRRDDLRRAALRSLDFLHERALTKQGVYHLLDPLTGVGQTRGQLEPNAWAALAFLEGYRASGAEQFLRAAEEIIRYASGHLFDPTHGVFVDTGEDGRASAGNISLEANGVVALALVRAHQVTGRREYRERALRILATLGGEARRRLSDDPEGVPVKEVAETVLFLRAYGALVGGRENPSSLPTGRYSPRAG